MFGWLSSHYCRIVLLFFSKVTTNLLLRILRIVMLFVLAKFFFQNLDKTAPEIFRSLFTLSKLQKYVTSKKGVIARHTLESKQKMFNLQHKVFYCNINDCFKVLFQKLKQTRQRCLKSTKTRKWNQVPWMGEGFILLTRGYGFMTP